MGILSARLGHDLIERGFKAAGANSTLDQERSARTVAFQNQGQWPKRLGKPDVVVSLAGLTMDEYGTGSGQGVGIGERLIGEQQAFIGTHSKGLQAEATRTVPGRHLGMCRMAVLWRAHGCSRVRSETFRNTLNAVEVHGFESMGYPRRWPPESCAQSE